MFNRLFFVKILSFTGFFTFPFWVYLSCFYLPDSVKYDFIQNPDEFTSIGAFVVLIVLFVIQALISIIVSILAISKKKNKETNLVLKLGVFLNFLPLVLFICFLIYLTVFYV